jgi:signal transduction histidine kinase
MARAPQIVIGPDRVVLAATPDLPRELVDRRLDDCTTLPEIVRATGRTLVDKLRRSPDRVLTETVSLNGDQPLQLVAVEALAIRRAATNLRTLLPSKLAVIASQALAAGVELSINVDDNVPAVVHVDTDKLAWAVTTLVGNALRYVQSAGRNAPRGTIRVRVTHDAAAASVTIEVRDNGPGIPSESVARLFKRDGLNVRGTGLALLLMSDILGGHGGKVEVQSETGLTQGTTVRLTFPTG